MAYFAPYIDATGLVIPTYQEIEDFLVETAKDIFGQDIYLGNDSQDFQDIAARALNIYESYLTAQLAYNARSPLTAVGVGLDGVVALNGVTRKGATYSTATVTLTGTPYTLITNGVVSDANGNKWNLPTSVTLDDDGVVSVTATCQVTGAIAATPGQINTIVTPTFGWQSVTNPAAATLGEAQETDSELRARQALSVANPSQALCTGILGSVLAVENVSQAQLYENDTNVAVDTINGAYNPNDYPPHSITLVVDGGDSAEIANAIYLRKTPGCYTNGDVEETIVDRYNVATTIRFYRPTDKDIVVAIELTPLTGYNSAVADAIKQAVVDYLNALNIGQNIVISELWQAILSVDTNQYPLFSLKLVEAAIDPASPAAIDISMDFDWKANCVVGDVSITEV